MPFFAAILSADPTHTMQVVGMGRSGCANLELLGPRAEEKTRSGKLGGRALGELVDARSLLKGSRFGGVPMHICACVCVAIAVDLSCLKQALCQVRDKYSWLSCWAHLYNYTCLFKKPVFQMQ